MRKALFPFVMLLTLVVTVSCKKNNDDPQPEPFVPKFTQGDVFYSDVDGDIYWMHDPEGAATIKKIHENANKTVEDILIDQKTNKIYLANYSDDKIYVADFDGSSAITPIEFVSIAHPKSLALWDKDGKKVIYAASTGNGLLKEINVNTKDISEPNFGQGAETVQAVAVDNVNGKIYINQDNKGIGKMPDNTVIVMSDINEGKIDVDPAGGTLYWIHYSPFFQSVKSDLSGNNQQVIGTTAGNINSESVSYDPVNKNLYYAHPNEANGRLMRRNLGNNQTKIFSTEKVRAITVVK